MLAGLSDGQTMLCVAAIFGVVEPRRKHRSIWKGDKEQGRARTGGDVEEELVGGRGYVLPEDREPQNHLQERTAQDRARPTGGAATAAQEGERMTAEHWRESMSPRSTNRSCLRSARRSGRRR